MVDLVTTFCYNHVKCLWQPCLLCMGSFILNIPQGVQNMHYLDTLRNYHLLWVIHSGLVLFVCVIILDVLLLDNFENHWRLRHKLVEFIWWVIDGTIETIISHYVWWETTPSFLQWRVLRSIDATKLPASILCLTCAVSHTHFLSSHTFPPHWKVHKIFPIPKKGDSHLVEKLIS